MKRIVCFVCLVTIIMVVGCVSGRYSYLNFQRDWCEQWSGEGSKVEYVITKEMTLKPVPCYKACVPFREAEKFVKEGEHLHHVAAEMAHLRAMKGLEELLELMSMDMPEVLYIDGPKTGADCSTSLRGMCYNLCTQEPYRDEIER